MCVLTIAFDLRWVTIVIAYGFVARVLTGPTLSPLGQFVTRVVTPRLGIAERPVAGPPKRFAQGMGVAFSVTALILTGLGYGRRPRSSSACWPRRPSSSRRSASASAARPSPSSCASAWCPKRCASAATTSGATHGARPERLDHPSAQSS